MPYLCNSNFFFSRVKSNGYISSRVLYQYYEHYHWLLLRIKIVFQLKTLKSITKNFSVQIITHCSNFQFSLSKLFIWLRFYNCQEITWLRMHVIPCYLTAVGKSKPINYTWVTNFNFICALISVQSPLSMGLILQHHKNQASLEQNLGVKNIWSQRG